MDTQFEGDRVAAFVVACADMLIVAHNGEMDFTMLSRLEAQHIYNAARNIDIAAWILASRKLPKSGQDKEGDAILLSDEINSTVRNTSFSKELGAISARLDLVAQLMSEKYQRLGVGIVQTLIAGPILQFLPVR